VTHVVAAKDGSEKAIAARKIPGCVLVKPGWLMESYWSMQQSDVGPYLMARGPSGKFHQQHQESPSHGVLKESNMSTDGSNDSDDDDFAAELEDELMSG
jgi:hypothetical protein